MFSKSFAILYLFSLVISQEVTGIFTRFNSLEWKPAADYPFQGPRYPNWIADLSWMIDGSKVTKGDTFTLHMPCVFKFTTSDSEVNLNVSGKTYATCSFAPGDVVVDYSELKCVVSDSVGPSTYAYGTVHFPFSFNVGGSGLTTDLNCAPIFHEGVNTVSFYDGDNELSTDVKFVGGASTDPTVIVRENRLIPSLNTEQHYLLAGECANGYQSATIGFSVLKDGVRLDCDSMHSLITDKLNDWYFPESATQIPNQVSCSSNLLTVTFANIPSGFTPFADVFMRINPGISNQIKYINQYQCVGSSHVTDNSKTVTWSPYVNDSPGANGQEVIVTTQTWTGSTTHVTTLPYTTGTGTITIEVNVPIPTVTTTTTCDCPAATSTFTATPGDTATVIEYIPEVTTEEDVSSTEDGASSTTSDEEVCTTEEEEAPTTSDEELSSTEEEGSSTTSEEEIFTTEEEESSTSDEEVSSTEDEESFTTSDEETTGTGDEESATTIDAEVSTCEEPLETSSDVVGSTITGTEDESASDIEDSTSIEPQESSDTAVFTTSTDEPCTKFETSSDVEEPYIVEESSSSLCHSTTIEIETSSDLEETTSAIESLNTSSNEEPFTPKTTEVSVLSESTTHPVEESSSGIGHEGESSTTFFEESSSIKIGSSKSQTFSTNISESSSIQESFPPADEESSTIETSTASTQYITTTIIDGRTTTVTVSEATTITADDDESLSTLSGPANTIPVHTSTEPRANQSSGIASNGRVSTFDTTFISTTKVGSTDADDSATARVTSRSNEPSQWTTGSASVPNPPETFLGSASSLTLSAMLVIFIEIIATLIL
ncbi:uncharacterized protein J8A68_001482 [[Candida] subhashii]|uniref:Agglutinin-like protein N-terminal domain-containing protein n=1 Tax=[Candida] subhashii TaxID=561895 RepID=A0A8J5QU43_9ASCO|nr:uncharacterized protein J8A68_001482 [[Candida] subhashii]KAG7665017.1 hypothetical protein J8A68_001482 [[Candida] subhashii]